MKAIRVQQYGGPEQLKLEDVPVPQPDSGQVLVRVHATSLNPFDYKLASGAFREQISMKLPYSPGGDFSGVVEKTGAGVTTMKPGDAVYGNCPFGAYAEFVVAPAKSIAPKPQKLNHIEAASVPVAAQTAWQGLFDHGHLERGQRVLVHAAAGGVGSFAVQLAHWKGARVFATASADHALYVKSLGADEVIDYKATQFETVERDLDMVLDLLGGETQARSFVVIKPGGRLVSTVMPPPKDLAAKHKVQASMFSMQPTTAGLQLLAELFDSGKLQTSVTKTYPLARAQEAWREILSGHTRGKIVLEVNA